MLVSEIENSDGKVELKLELGGTTCTKLETIPFKWNVGDIVDMVIVVRYISNHT